MGLEAYGWACRPNRILVLFLQRGLWEGLGFMVFRVQAVGCKVHAPGIGFGNITSEP